MIRRNRKSAELIKPLVVGKDVKRYASLPDGKWMICIPCGFTNEKRGKSGPRAFMEAEYPAIMGHLREWEKQLKKRVDKGDYWWELRACRYYSVFGKPKIVYPNISQEPNFTLDSDGILTNQKCFVIPTNDKCLLAILNSSLCMFFFKNVLPELRGGYYEPSLVSILGIFPFPRLGKASEVQSCAASCRICRLRRFVRRVKWGKHRIPIFWSPGRACWRR